MTPYSQTFVNFHIWKSTHKLIKGLAEFHGMTMCRYLHNLILCECVAIGLDDTESVQTGDVDLSTQSVQTGGVNN